MPSYQITMSLWPRVELESEVAEETMNMALDLLTERSGKIEVVHFRCRCLPGLTKLDLLELYGVTMVQVDELESYATVETGKLPPLVRGLWTNHIGFEGLINKPKGIHYYPAVSLVRMVLEVFEIYW